MGAAPKWLSPALLIAASRASPTGNDVGRPAAYSHASGAVASNPSWMAGLPDTARLSELSLPGTHDTMSLHGADFTETQSMDLADQLVSGVRAIDIRCLHTHNSCEVHHGIIDQRASLWDVLVALRDFLVQYPSEAVLMRLAQVHGGSGNNRSFNETWKSYSAGIDATRPKDSPLVWPSAGAGVDACWTTGVPSAADANPTLGEVRGKVVMLQDFGMSSRGCYGIPYPEAFDIQDNYVLSSNWALYGKWEAVRDQLDSASQGNQSTFFVNYLSGAVGAFPYFVASGQSSPSTGAPRLLTGRISRGGSEVWPDFPRVGCLLGLCSIAFEGTNILAAEWLLSHRGRVGVVMADFPGPDLLGRVIRQNWNASEDGENNSVDPPAFLL